MNRSVPVFSRQCLKHSCRPSMMNLARKLDQNYSFLRAFLPDLLVALTFTGTSAAKPVVRAIEALKQMDAEGRRKLPADAPRDFLPDEWLYLDRVADRRIR